MFPESHGAFKVRMTGATHPVTKGMSDFTVTDEPYTGLDGKAPITVLCDATSEVDKKVYPMASTVENTGGRVFHCVLGHDASVYKSTEFGNLDRRAAAWAAGIEPGLPQ